VTKPEPEKVNPLKRPMDPKDAKERARRLIMSGKINLGNKKAEVKTTFKRPRALERKILATGRSEGHGGLTPGYNASYPGLDSIQFEPFTPNPDGPLDIGLGGGGGNNSKSDSGGSPYESGGGGGSGGGSKKYTGPSIKPFSSSLSSMKDSHGGGGGGGNGGGNGGDYSSGGSGNKGGSGGGGGQTQQRPKRGPTIYIQAHNLTDDILRDQFGKFGTIVNVKLNNQSVGFVTYDCTESAELAIREVSLEDIIIMNSWKVKLSELLCINNNVLYLLFAFR
jgi:hypothetical protein